MEKGRLSERKTYRVRSYDIKPQSNRNVQWMTTYNKNFINVNKNQSLCLDKTVKRQSQEFSPANSINKKAGYKASSDLKLPGCRQKISRPFNEIIKSNKISVGSENGECICQLCTCGGCRCDLPQTSNFVFPIKNQCTEYKENYYIKKISHQNPIKKMDDYIFPRVKYLNVSTNNDLLKPASPKLLKSCLFSKMSVRKVMDKDEVPDVPFHKKKRHSTDFQNYEETQLEGPLKPKDFSGVDKRLPFFLVKGMKNYGENIEKTSKIEKPIKQTSKEIKSILFKDYALYETSYKSNFPGKRENQPQSQLKRPDELKCSKLSIPSCFYKPKNIFENQGQVSLCKARPIMIKKRKINHLREFS